MTKTLIIGAGYAGLAAAIELNKRGSTFTIVEKQSDVGGLSRSFYIGETLFELGPHIYFDKDVEVTDFWRKLIGNKLKSHLRSNRIYFEGKYIRSPLNLFDAIIKISPFKAAYIFFSSFASKFGKYKIESAEDWVIAYFGKGLYKYFFKVYNEKIWGLDCKDISATWAGQRIKTSLADMIYRSLVRDQKFIVKSFDFPDGGSITLCEAQQALLDASPNASLKLNTVPTSILHSNNRFKVSFSDGSEDWFDHLIATCHLSDLVKVIQHPQINTVELSECIHKLIYRNLILVNLVFCTERVLDFNEHWIDIHDSSIKALRVTNFSNYSLNQSRAETGSFTKPPLVGIGLEYNCFHDDSLWNSSDEVLLEMAMLDLKKMKLVSGSPSDFSILRFEKAYPVYFKGYEKILERIQTELGKVVGLELAGRNALYRWNNMHHSVKTGILAARNCSGERHNLNSVKGMVTFGKDSD